MSTTKLSEKPDKLQGGGGVGATWMASIPSRRSSNAPSRLMLQKPRLAPSGDVEYYWLVFRLYLYLIVPVAIVFLQSYIRLKSKEVSASIPLYV